MGGLLAAGERSPRRMMSAALVTDGSFAVGAGVECIRGYETGRIVPAREVWIYGSVFYLRITPGGSWAVSDSLAAGLS